MAGKKQSVQLEGQKLMFHVEEVSKWLKGEDVAPIYVEIGPIDLCNHNCIFCAFDYLKSKGAIINKDVLVKTLKNMSDFGVKSVMFAGEGEPLIYPNLPEVIDNAKTFGLDIAITTNGISLTKQKVESMMTNISWIKFSIDAGTKETYAKVHGCKEKDFDKLLENIKYVCEYKKKNNLDYAIGCQIIIIPHNVEEVEKLILNIKNLGVDYLALKPYSQHPNSINKMILDLKKFDKKLSKLSRRHSDSEFNVIYRDISAKEIEQNEIFYDICYGINFFALIDALGNVMPCNLYYEREEYFYGSINKNTFEKIWKSDKRKKVVGKLHAKGCSDCRKGCRLNFVNKYLDTLKNRDIPHINFI